MTTLVSVIAIPTQINIRAKGCFMIILTCFKEIGLLSLVAPLEIYFNILLSIYFAECQVL